MKKNGADDGNFDIPDDFDPQKFLDDIMSGGVGDEPCEPDEPCEFDAVSDGDSALESVSVELALESTLRVFLEMDGKECDKSELGDEDDEREDEDDEYDEDEYDEDEDEDGESGGDLYDTLFSGASNSRFDASEDGEDEGNEDDTIYQGMLEKLSTIFDATKVFKALILAAGAKLPDNAERELKFLEASFDISADIGSVVSFDDVDSTTNVDLLSLKVQEIQNLLYDLLIVLIKIAVVVNKPDIDAYIITNFGLDQQLISDLRLNAQREATRDGVENLDM